ncbi:hypothetical protein C8Q80DRAFT_1171069 [Daedaleopsis nitida]|nr:hypothetical protein C8Q80DRAFT_1171069 [Daedaleopsis nitida]
MAKLIAACASYLIFPFARAPAGTSLPRPPRPRSSRRTSSALSTLSALRARSVDGRGLACRSSSSSPPTVTPCSLYAECPNRFISLTFATHPKPS